MSNLSNDNQKVSLPATVTSAFVEHQRALKRYISRFIHNTAEIEDVSQEAYLRAFAAEKERKIEQPKSFLFRIAHNVALTALNKKSRRITDYIEDSDASDVLIDEGTVEQELMANESIAIHCEAVAELPPQRRRVYLLRKVYGKSHKEIAAHLDISVSTVEKHLIKGTRQCDLYIRNKNNMDNTLLADVSDSVVKQGSQRGRVQ